MSTQKWNPFFLDTNMYAELIDNEDSWKKCVSDLKAIGKFEEIMTAEQQEPVSSKSPVARFGFPKNTGKTLTQFFQENNMGIDPK